MSAPNTHEVHDQDIAEIVEENALNPVTDSRGVNRLVRQLIAVLTQFIVSVSRRPIVALIESTMVKQQAAIINMLKIDLHGDQQFITQVRKDLDYNMDATVAAAVAAALGNVEDRIKDEVKRQMVLREKALMTTLARRNRRTYPFAMVFALIGAVIGGIASWFVLNNYFLNGTVVDGTGKSWVATSIAEQPAFVGSFIFAWVVLAGGLGGLIGWIIDSIRNRRR